MQNVAAPKLKPLFERQSKVGDLPWFKELDLQYCLDTKPLTGLERRAKMLLQSAGESFLGGLASPILCKGTLSWGSCNGNPLKC